MRIKFRVRTLYGVVSQASAQSQVCTVKSPCVDLNNGVKMPIISLGTWQYNDTVAADAIAKGMEVGFTHIDTAESYKNQVGVGAALKGLPRDSFFLTTKTLPCKALTTEACEAQATSDFLGDLNDLGLDYVDLILLHGPSHTGPGSCNAFSCEKDKGQWAAYEKLYAAGKAKAIGVSNYCNSCLTCLLANATVVPAVNQFEIHVGMGTDPAGMVSNDKKHGIVPQAYSPLGDGTLVSDPRLAAIGKKLGKSGPQVALKWVVQNGWAVSTKADSAEYLAEDLDVFSWNISAADMATLNAATTPANNPSWACTA